MSETLFNQTRALHDALKAEGRDADAKVVADAWVAIETLETDRDWLRRAPVEQAGTADRIEHKCEKLADFSRFFRQDDGHREWWVGRLLEPIEGFEHERWCLHITTPLKPNGVVFGMNDADWQYMVCMAYACLGWHVNPVWVEAITKGGMRAAGRDRGYPKPLALTAEETQFADDFEKDALGKLHDLIDGVEDYDDDGHKTFYQPTIEEVASDLVDLALNAFVPCARVPDPASVEEEP